MPKIKEMPPELQYFFEKGFSAPDRLEAIVVNKSDNFVEQIAVKGRITLDDGVVRESEIRLNTLAADLIQKIGVAVECGRSQKINSIYAAILRLKDPNADSLQDDDDTLRDDDADDASEALSLVFSSMFGCDCWDNGGVASKQSQRWD
jgi:hypothetical protein